MVAHNGLLSNDRPNSVSHLAAAVRLAVALFLNWNTGIFCLLALFDGIRQGFRHSPQYAVEFEGQNNWIINILITEVKYNGYLPPLRRFSLWALPSIHLLSYLEWLALCVELLLLLWNSAMWNTYITFQQYNKCFSFPVDGFDWLWLVIEGNSHLFGNLTSCTSFRFVMKSPKCQMSIPNLSAQDATLKLARKHEHTQRPIGLSLTSPNTINYAYWQIPIHTRCAWYWLTLTPFDYVALPLASPQTIWKNKSTEDKLCSASPWLFAFQFVFVQTTK